MIQLDDIIAAHQKIRPFVKETPLESFPALDAAIGHGIRLLVKPELLQTTGSFKVRNAFSALLALPPEARERGVIAASTGNLGQALALAGQMLHIPVAICVKQDNHPAKNKAILSRGAELIEAGKDYEEALGHAMAIAAERGIPYIRSSQNKAALSGAATVGLEIIDSSTAIDRIVLAVGSGAHAAGAGIVARARKHSARITGMQASNACTIHDHWHHISISSGESYTIADAIAMGSGHYQDSVDLLTGNLSDFITATDDQIMAAIRLAHKTTGYVVEPAGAIGLAGVMANTGKWANETIVIVFSGGNLSQKLQYLLE